MNELKKYGESLVWPQRQRERESGGSFCCSLCIIFNKKTSVTQVYLLLTQHTITGVGLLLDIILFGGKNNL